MSAINLKSGNCTLMEVSAAKLSAPVTITIYDGLTNSSPVKDTLTISSSTPVAKIYALTILTGISFEASGPCSQLSFTYR